VKFGASMLPSHLNLKCKLSKWYHISTYGNSLQYISTMCSTLKKCCSSSLHAISYTLHRFLVPITNVTIAAVTATINVVIIQLINSQSKRLAPGPHRFIVFSQSTWNHSLKIVPSKLVEILYRQTSLLN